MTDPGTLIIPGEALPEGVWLIELKNDRAPKRITVEQRAMVREMFSVGQTDRAIAADTGINDIQIVSRVRNLMGLMARNQSPFGITGDRQPRQLISDGRLNEAYAGRRYG